MPASNVLPDRLAPERAAMDRGAMPAEPARSASAVSWASIIAGAAGAAALSLIMLILGIGLGLSTVSPWAQAGITAATFGVSTIVWITFTQLVASGMGGYLAGRLRTKWAAVHTDEVYFRDTAHGFLAWAIATLATAALLGSTIGAIVSGGAQAGASVVGGAASALGTAGTAAATAAAGNGMSGGAMSATSGNGYYIDSLFRKDPNAASGAAAPAAATSAAGTPAAPEGPPPVAEAGRIFASGIKNGSMPADDTHYLGQLVAQRTGLPQADAEKRVSDTFNRMQTSLKDAQNAAMEAADKARKASAYGALWLFVSLLVGAFVASYSATIGGRQRDA